MTLQRPDAPGAWRAPPTRPLGGHSGQGKDQRAEPGLSAKCPVAPAEASPLRTDAHFPLFMLLWDSHSFRLSELGTVHRLRFSQSLLCGLPGGQPRLPGPIAPGLRPSVPKLGP